MKKLAIPLALGVVLTPVSVLALIEVGYVGIWASTLESWSSLQVILDLLLCVSIAFTALTRDARERGVTLWPWMVGTLFLGSPVLLAYLVVRELRRAPATA